MTALAPRTRLLFLSRPALGDRARALGAAPLSYGLAGATRGALPAGWRHDDREVVLGTGDATWDAARAALDRWVHFDLGWVRLEGSPPIREGQVVAFAARQLGLWTLNVCRVVYVVDEDGPVARYGFAYGTLDSHAVAGEERFELRYDRASGEVIYRIAKFSRLRHPLVRLAAPLAHYLQDRFTTDSLARMKREVAR